MDKRKKILLVAGTAAALALAGGGLAYAGGAVGSDGDKTLTGPDADRAGRVAVDSVGGGTVVRVSQDNEAGVAYDVEVKKPNGTTTDIGVTKDFSVAPSEPEGAE